jgi:hypothetical protein
MRAALASDREKRQRFAVITGLDLEPFGDLPLDEAMDRICHHISAPLQCGPYGHELLLGTEAGRRT